MQDVFDERHKCRETFTNRNLLLMETISVDGKVCGLCVDKGSCKGGSSKTFSAYMPRFIFLIVDGKK